MNSPIVVAQHLNAPITTVWEALTNPDQIRHWFYDLDNFELQPGSSFFFYTGGEEEKYQHVCKVLEIVPKEKLVISWQYGDIDGCSIVTIELLPDGAGTFIKLTHTGVESFPQNDIHFTKETIEADWTNIICLYLKEYVENK